ncbi:VHR1 Transcription factor VHR1 [Candida maltosa Xu316]
MDSNKKLGVTHAIRERLNFHDERLWKRFSARRLELIDTLDLSSRKASEQEQEIKKVAETLRAEFNYPVSYTADFNKLVRAAVQSVRRNRKRSHKKTDDHHYDDGVVKKQKVDHAEQDSNNSANSFLSEIVRNEEEVYDVNYNRSKVFTSNDQAKDTIDNMTKPRLPPLANLSMNETVKIPSAANAKKNILNKIERSRSCNESVNNSRSENLQFLGKSVMSTCIGYVFEKSFMHVNPQSMTYLRNKLDSQVSIAKFFRDLDPVNTNSINDETAVISLYILLGSMVKDFGFEEVISPICEVLYATVLQEYPLIAKNAIPFKPEERTNYSLSKLAEVATRLQTTSTTSTLVSSTSNSPHHSPTPPPPPPALSYKKRVYLKFLHQKLELFYPVRTAATPRFNELLENAKSAFKLPDTTIIIKHRNENIQSDLDLERVFKGDEDIIELEIFTHNSLPIYEMHRMLSSQVYSQPQPQPQVQPTILENGHRIILPPPINSALNNNGQFKFLSNSDEISSVTSTPPPPPPPQPILPRFQPLL